MFWGKEKRRELGAEFLVLPSFPYQGSVPVDVEVAKGRKEE